jgi:nitroreductase
MELSHAIAGRRSVRKYQPAAVPRAKLAAVIEAARLAPTAANRQPWKLYVVEDPALRRELGKAYKNPWFFEAPAILVMCSLPKSAWTRADGKNYADVDAAIAFDHMTLVAHAEGLGTCWIAAFNAQIVKDALKLPAGEEPLAMSPLGEPAEVPRQTPRKPVGELVVFR